MGAEEQECRSPWPCAAQIQRLQRIVTEDMRVSGSNFSVVASPYRICPLGAHVDHQGGAVTAMALDRGVLLGFVTSNGPEVRVRSGQFSGEVSFRFGLGQEENEGCCKTLERQFGWGDYARGAVHALLSRGYNIVHGIVGFVDGCDGLDGCGVSSSAALGIAFLLALEHANGLKVSAQENVELDRVIENEYLGLRNGVLDQSAILLSQRGALTLIRCNERTHQVVPLGTRVSSGYKIILAFSGLRHALTSKPGFNLRVSECQDAAKLLLKAVGRESMQPILGNVTAEEYVVHRNKLGDGALAKRARHFFTESSRVEAGVRAWTAGDLETFGKLMSDSGRSSIENYECGCQPLIDLWKILLAAPGVLGARFSGAGFRGCCVALVKADLADEAANLVRDKYREAQPELCKNVDEDGAVLICESGENAHVII